MLSRISATTIRLGLFATIFNNIVLASVAKQFAPASSIGISAKEIGSARNIVTYWQTSWGSFDRDYLATRDIEIEIHNLSRLPARLVIDFYFVGRPQRLPTSHKLFSKRSFIVDVAPGYQERLSLRSDVLRSHEVYYATLGQNYTSGHEIEGWILFARLPGQPQPFDKASSSKAMLEHMDWFPAALRDFENATHTHANYASEIEPEPTPPPEVAETGVEPSTSVIVVRPSPPMIESPGTTAFPAAPTPTQASPPAPIFITITEPTKIVIGRGEQIIPAGTKVQLVARASDMVQVRYKGDSAFVKISSTDLK